MRTWSLRQSRAPQTKSPRCSMLRSYIESRERALHRHDSNRKSLPFEWGLEHISLAQNGSPLAALRDFAANALKNSEAFYSCSPTTHYEFDGEILKFPSAVTTPYPENNTVWKRFFDGEKNLAVVVLPQ